MHNLAMEGDMHLICQQAFAPAAPGGLEQVHEQAEFGAAQAPVAVAVGQAPGGRKGRPRARARVQVRGLGRADAAQPPVTLQERNSGLAAQRTKRERGQQPE